MAKLPVALSVGLLLVLSAWRPAAAPADSAPAIIHRPREYEAPVRLTWNQIPFATFPYDTPAGWKLYNPTGFSCEKRWDGNYLYCSDDRFVVRVKVNPHLKEATILNGWWVEE